MTDVLIFDSGVGGLSVSAEIRQRMPAAALDYVCDNAALPYGTKPDDWLISRIVDVCSAACELSRPRVLVVACNTASTLALKALRARLTIPVVGTVPAIKPAAAVSRSRVIGILATSATIDRPYLKRLIADFAPDCRVERVAADALVLEAERYMATAALDEAVCAEALAPLWHIDGLDTVVLGCTHFPLLRECLASLAPPDLRWVDSGRAIARRVESLLHHGQSPLRREQDPSGHAAVPNGAAGRRSWATQVDVPGLSRALERFGFAAPSRLDLAVPDIVTGVY